MVRSQLPAILAHSEQELLDEWLRQQPSVAGVSEAQAAAQSAAFLRALVEATASGEAADSTGSRWSALRGLVAEIAAARSDQGIPPAQIAEFVFSLKKPLFARLRSELGGDPDALAGALWSATAWLDELGLAAVEIASRCLEGKRRESEALRREGEERLRQAQNLEAVGRLAGGIAHDFNNMLGVVIGTAEMECGRIPPGDPIGESLQQILKAAESSRALVGQLLAFARRQTVEPRVLDLNTFVRESEKMLARLMGEDIDVQFTAGENLWLVKIDPGQIDQILAHLMVNARDAIAGTGNVRLETRNVVLDEIASAQYQGARPGEYVLLELSDSGTGIDQEIQQRIFEPFFTTKELGKGTGLGLSSVYGIVQQNHGFINVYSEVGQGTTFRIYLPRHLGSPTERKEAAVDLVPTGAETILVVEDNPQLLRLCQEMLKRLGYTILSAALPTDALTLCTQHPGDIQLIMTDVVMPGMNGRELLERIEQLRPGIKALFMSGYTADVIADRGVLPEGVQFVQKPFSRSTLAMKVREVLDQ